MQKRTSAVTGAPSKPAVESVMTPLETQQPNRVRPADINVQKEAIDANYTEASALGSVLSADHESYIDSLASRSAKLAGTTRAVYQAQVQNDTATNLSRMKYFDEGAIVAESKDKNQQDTMIYIEMLFAGVKYGSARAVQSLLEENEKGTIVLTVDEIQDLVATQIFWSVDAKNAAQLEATKFLPALINLPKAWAAVRQNQALYQRVLEVVYLDSGVKCQELIEANEAGVINLRSDELRALVANQMQKYRDSQDKVGQCVPRLLENPKVWAAMQETPKESYNLLLEFFENVMTRELLTSLKFATLADLMAATENDPAIFLTALEDKEHHDKTHVISAEDRVFTDARVRVLKAMFALRHAVYALDQKEIYAMRPVIAKKVADNQTADAKATRDFAAASETTEKQNAAELEENPDPAVTIKYIGEGRQTGFAKYIDTTKGEVLFEERAKLDDKIAEAQRKLNKHSGKDASKAAEAQKNLDRYSARLETAAQAYTKYQERVVERQQALDALKEAQRRASVKRGDELQELKDHEQELNDALRKSNPIERCIQLALLAMIQDTYAYGISTSSWGKLIFTSLEQDAHAIDAGAFAYAVVTTTTMLGVTKTEITEAYPPILKDSSPAHARMLAILKSGALENFWARIEDDLFDADGKVTCPDAAPKGHIDPLQALLNTSMALALLITVKQIAPKYDAEYTEVMQYNTTLRSRLNKLVKRSDAPTMLRNYILVALMAASDKPALARLLLRDQSNPFVSVLQLHGINTDGYLSVKGKTEEQIEAISDIKNAMKQISNTQALNIEMADINKGYDVLAYLQSQLIEAGTNTEIDFLIFECFCYTIHARYMEYCQAYGHAKTEVNPIHFTNEASKRRKERAARQSIAGNSLSLNNTRRSSLDTNSVSLTTPSSAVLTEQVSSRKRANSVVDDAVTTAPLSFSQPLAAIVEEQHQDEGLELASQVVSTSVVDNKPEDKAVAVSSAVLESSSNIVVDNVPASVLSVTKTPSSSPVLLPTATLEEEHKDEVPASESVSTAVSASVVDNKPEDKAVAVSSAEVNKDAPKFIPAPPKSVPPPPKNVAPPPPKNVAPPPPKNVAPPPPVVANNTSVNATSVEVTAEVKKPAFSLGLVQKAENSVSGENLDTTAPVKQTPPPPPPAVVEPAVEPVVEAKPVVVLPVQLNEIEADRRGSLLSAIAAAGNKQMKPTGNAVTSSTGHMTVKKLTKKEKDELAAQIRAKEIADGSPMTPAEQLLANRRHLENVNDDEGFTLGNGGNPGSDYESEDDFETGGTVRKYTDEQVALRQAKRATLFGSTSSSAVEGSKTPSPITGKI